MTAINPEQTSEFDNIPNIFNLLNKYFQHFKYYYKVVASSIHYWRLGTPHLRASPNILTEVSGALFSL